jgi:hypothetical protein
MPKLLIVKFTVVNHYVIGCLPANVDIDNVRGATYDEASKTGGLPDPVMDWVKDQPEYEEGKEIEVLGVVDPMKPSKMSYRFGHERENIHFYEPSTNSIYSTADCSWARSFVEDDAQKLRDALDKGTEVKVRRTPAL